MQKYYLKQKIIKIMADTGRKITVVGIKEVYYGEPLKAAPTKATIEALKTASTKVDNVHGETFKYEEAEPNKTQHKNQLNGKVYRVDVEDGEVSIAFTVGEYDYQTKASLQGGVATADSWTRPKKTPIIYKSIIAITNDDVCIVLPKASVVANGTDADKAVGLGVKAVALDAGTLDTEYWFDGATPVA